MVGECIVSRYVPIFLAIQANICVDIRDKEWKEIILPSIVFSVKNIHSEHNARDILKTVLILIIHTFKISSYIQGVLKVLAPSITYKRYYIAYTYFLFHQPM